MYKHDDILRMVQDEKTGITDYYAYVNKKKVKISKKQYRYLERVNRRQRYLNELAAQLNCVSYDALIEALLNPDQRAFIPRELCVESAEDAFFRKEEERERSIFLGYYLYYASTLPYPTDRIVLESLLLHKTEEELGTIYHLPASTVHDRKAAGMAKALKLTQEITGVRS